jgi:hypothetical protein
MPDHEVNGYVEYCIKNVFPTLVPPPETEAAQELLQSIVDAWKPAVPEPPASPPVTYAREIHAKTGLIFTQ